MKIVNPDKAVTNTPYKIIKLISGEDILCKIIQEYTDAVVVEYPMSIAKHQVIDQPDHVVEHTGLQRWINFTHDRNFVIEKQKITSVTGIFQGLTEKQLTEAKRPELPENV